MESRTAGHPVDPKYDPSCIVKAFGEDALKGKEGHLYPFLPTVYNSGPDTAIMESWMRHFEKKRTPYLVTKRESANPKYDFVFSLWTQRVT